MPTHASAAGVAGVFVAAALIAADLGRDVVGSRLDAALACPSAPFVIRNVRVFDGDTVRAGLDVYVADERITAVGRNLRVPTGTPECSGAGATLLPGLIDAHAHVNDPADLTGALRFGVTTVLDQFSDLDVVMRPLRKTGVADQSETMADVRSAGIMVTSKGGHGAEYKLHIPTLDSADSATAFIAARIEEGSDYIKIAYDNGDEWHQPTTSIDRETMVAAVRAAAARKKPSVVHIGAVDKTEHVIAARPTVITHVPVDTVPSPGFGARFRESGAVSIPTIAALIGMASKRFSVRDSADWQWLQGVLDARQLQYLTAEHWRPAQHSSTQAVEAIVTDMIEQGVPILAGTDAPLPTIPFGLGLHYEMRFLHHLGLPPLEVLRAATSRPARVFNLPDRGRIAPGLRADLLLSAGDVAAAPSHSLYIRSVWKRGRLVDRRQQRLAERDSVFYWGRDPSVTRETPLVDCEAEPHDPASPAWTGIWTVYRAPERPANNSCVRLRWLHDNGDPASTYASGNVVQLVARVRAPDTAAVIGLQNRRFFKLDSAIAAPSLLYMQLRGTVTDGRLELELVAADGTVLCNTPVTVSKEFSGVTLPYHGLPPAVVRNALGWRLVLKGGAGSSAKVDVRNSAEY